MLTNLALATMLVAPTGSGPVAALDSNTLLEPTVISLTGILDDLPKAASAVSIRTEDKLLLKATYFAPKKKSRGKAPAALLIHDEEHSREELEELASYLHRRGFAVLTLDLRGHGDSATDDLVFKKCDEKDKKRAWDLAGRDVAAAAEYLLDQDGVHTSNLSVIGFGAGASLAVRQADADENVRTLVLVEPELETYEYDLVKGVMKLEGLPTLVVSTKEGKDNAKKIQSEAHDAADGLEFVDLEEVRCKPDEMAGDKTTMKKAGGWLRDQAMPKR